MFQTIGKYWAEGYLPYVDLFDHKGPMIFLINAIGYAICGRTGVYILQSLFLAVSEYIGYKLLRCAFNEKISLIGALLMPLVLVCNWEEGNTTEEYILPLLFAGYYLMYRWCQGLKDGKVTHKARWAFVYGLGLGFAIMTRATNALGLCLGVGIISVTLIVKGQWKNLLDNALGFVLGAAVMIVPFCIYFAAHGALYDMWYGTLIYNVQYMSGSGSASPESLLELIVALRLHLVGWCMIAVAIWGLVAKRSGRFSSLFWLIISLGNTVFMYTLNNYAHYGICLLPLLYVALCELKAGDYAQWSKSLTRFAALAVVAVVLCSAGLKVYKKFTVRLPDSAYEDIIDYGDDYSDLIAMIPEDGRESFIAFNCPRKLYLEAGIRPAFKYFTLQEWMIGNSPELGAEMNSEFLRSDIEWVLSFEADGTNSSTRQILEERYSLVAASEHSVYKLYHLN
jgi:hypothetical protein